MSGECLNYRAFKATSSRVNGRILVGLLKVLTLSPERGLFFGLLGAVSSLGLVSIAQ